VQNICQRAMIQDLCTIYYEADLCGYFALTSEAAIPIADCYGTVLLGL
jgi:hypothetical protein